MSEQVYKFYDNEIGVAVQYLISDGDKKNESLSLIKYSTLRKRINSLNASEKQLKRASLNSPALINFNSLCTEWRSKLINKFGNPPEKIKESIFKQNYKLDDKALQFYTSFRLQNNRKLDFNLIDKYVIQASVINTILNIKEDRKTYAKALGVVKLDIWNTLSKDVNAFNEVDHQLPTTRDSLRRKVTAYQKYGYASLISKKLQNTNSKKTKTKEQTALLDELIAKHTNLDNEIICSLYNTVAEQLEWSKITRKTVSNRKTKSNLVTFAGRNGTTALSNKLLMQHKRLKPSSPMLYWTLDGWDAELLYQEVKINKNGTKQTTYHNRLNIVTILDPFNNYPIGYAIGTHETPTLIQKALKDAFNHSKELFGDYYKPYQLQSDHYSIKKLKPFYKKCTKHFTPAKVKNAKSKVIERYFSTINTKYCKLFDNWSGHNSVTGSENQPNDEYLYKIRHSFPDKQGCIQQLEQIIQIERANKLDEFVKNWSNTRDEHKQIMSKEEYFLTFGETTGYTNKLRGNGLNITIENTIKNYDSFDLEFRKHAHVDWNIYYDTNDLTSVLATSPNGELRFFLDEKYIEPMALADRIDGDAKEGARINQYNKEVLHYISDEREQNINTINNLITENPQIKDTLQKLIIPDQFGQHKNCKNDERLTKVGRDVLEKGQKTQAIKDEINLQKIVNKYNSDRVNINEYI